MSGGKVLQTLFLQHTGGTSFLPSFLRLLLTLLASLVNEMQSDAFRLTLKRITLLTLLAYLWTLTMTINQLGFLLDDLFFPSWRHQLVESPIFIIGNARSGTTLMHKVLCASNKSSFVSFRLWEILFGQSVVFHSLLCFAFEADAFFFGGYLYYAICRMEGASYGRVRIHAIGLQEFEEDDWLMLSCGLCQLSLLLFPLTMDLLGGLIYFDELPLETRRNVFLYYRKCVQKRLFCAEMTMKKKKMDITSSASSFSLCFVAKNPVFTLRLNSLFHFFPDARIVCMVRDPAQSVPSMVSYIGKVSSCDK